jgi:malonyl-CoA O-methyltransferase
MNNHQQRVFSKIAPLYDRYAFINKEISQRLSQRISLWAPPALPHTILDAGCGTGFMQTAIESLYPTASFIGYDQSPEMLTQFRHKHPSSLAVCGRVEKMPFYPHSVDLLVSNGLLPYCPDPLPILKEWRRILKPQGALFFTSLGPDTLSELKKAWTAADPEHQHVQDFRDMHLLGDMLLDAGFSDPVLEKQNLCIHYKDPKTLLWNLKKSGSSYHGQKTRHSLTGKTLYNTVLDHYRSFQQNNGLYPLSIEIVYAHAIAPSKRLASTTTL